MLAALCVIIAVVGGVLTLLALLPATRPHVPAVGVGITLLVVGVVLYVVVVQVPALA